jgi:phosphohistidine phosphatase
MKTLLLLRHAKSDWDDISLDDHERPLNPRGLKAAPRMGQLMRDLDMIPALCLSSTAVRSRDTATLAIDALVTTCRWSLSRSSIHSAKARPSKR